MTILKRLKPGYVNNQRLYAFDVETYHVRKGDVIEQTFKMGSVVGDGFEFSTYDKDELAKMLVSKRMRGAYIFATNLDFDYTFVFQHTRHKKHLKEIMRSGKVISATYRNNRHHVTFLDTWNYTGSMELDYMGQQMSDCPKRCDDCYKKCRDNDLCRRHGCKLYIDLKLLTSESRDPFITEYNLRDCDITLRYGKKIKALCNELGCRLKKTISSVGLDYWRRISQPHDLFQERRDIVLKLYEARIHGGRVECLQRGHVAPGRMKYYDDFNSSYPARCKEGVDGKGSYPDPNTVRYLEGGSVDMIKRFHGISRVDVYHPYRWLPVLGLDYDGKYIFPYGTFSGWFTNIELRRLLDIGGEIRDVHEMIYYRGLWRPFVDIVDDLYPRRQRYKKQGDMVFSQLVKTMMNGGLFGKFGQKITGYETPHPLESLSLIDGAFYDGDRLIDTYLIRDDTLYETTKTPGRIRCFIFPILAIYTTALGRLALLDSMERTESIERRSTIYADTDSRVSFSDTGDSSSELGMMKREDMSERCCFIAPKTYIFGDIIKAKGVPLDLQAEQLLSGREIEYEHWLKTKESSRRKMPYGTIVPAHKRLSMVDTKRSWPKQERITDWVISEPIYLERGVRIERTYRSLDELDSGGDIIQSQHIDAV